LHHEPVGVVAGSLERARRDDDVTFFLEDPVHPQSMVALALLAGSTVKTWSYLFLK